MPVAPLLALLSVIAMPADAQSAPLQSTEGTVLFVCEHGTVKSLLAKLLFEEYAAQAGLPMRAESRGAAADSVVPPWMLSQLAARKLEIGEFRPRSLVPKDLESARLVVSFDLTPSVLTSPRAPQQRWDALPAASEQFEASHAAIRSRVHALVDSLVLARKARR